jgi:hypothetical protein
MLQRYFLPDDPRVHLLHFDGFLAVKFDLTAEVLLVMDPWLDRQRPFVDGQRVGDSGCPMGCPVFIAQARYARNIDQLLDRTRSRMLEQAG